MILPFDSFDLEALDRLAQGGESFDFAQDREPVEPFRISDFVLLISGLSGMGGYNAAF